MLVEFGRFIHCIRSTYTNPPDRRTFESADLVRNPEKNDTAVINVLFRFSKVRSILQHQQPKARPSAALEVVNVDEDVDEVAVPLAVSEEGGEALEGRRSCCEERRKEKTRWH